MMRLCLVLMVVSSWLRGPFVCGTVRWEPRADVIVYVPFDPVFCVFNYKESVMLSRPVYKRDESKEANKFEAFLGFEKLTRILPNGTGVGMEVQLMLAERLEFNLASWIYEPVQSGTTTDSRLRLAFVSHLNDFVINGQLDYTTLMNGYSKLSFANLKKRYLKYCHSQQMKKDAGKSGFCEILGLKKGDKGFDELNCRFSAFAQWSNVDRDRWSKSLKNITQVFRTKSQGRTIFALIPGFHIDVKGIFGELIFSGHQRPIFEDLKENVKPDPKRQIDIMVGLIMRDPTYRKWVKLVGNLNRLVAPFGELKRGEITRPLSDVYFAESLDYFPVRLKDAVMRKVDYRNCIEEVFTPISECYWVYLTEQCMQDFNLTEYTAAEQPFGEECRTDQVYSMDCGSAQNSTCVLAQRRIQLVKATATSIHISSTLFISSLTSISIIQLYR